MIEGRNPGDRPFMRVGRVTFHVPWWTIFRNLRRPEIHVEVHLTDWQMVVESWPGGIHNIPKLTPKNPSTGREAFTTTVDFAYATDGHFIYEDHGTPWRVDAPNLNFGLVRSTALQQYVGHRGVYGRGRPDPGLPADGHGPERPIRARRAARCSCSTST